jgi:hypothetical protein
MSFVRDEFFNESSMPHGAFAAALSDGITRDFESWRPRYNSRKINQYKGTGAPKRAVGVEDFDTADARVQVETSTGGAPDNPLARGLTLTWADGSIWWLESFTLSVETASAWTYDTVWQKKVS